MKITNHFRKVFGILGALSLVAASAKADLITYSLDNGNSDINPGYAPPYGTVQVDLTDPTHATITFSSDVIGGNIYLFGGAQCVDVNVNATSWMLSPVVGNNSGTGFSASSLSDGGSGNVDGRGSFDQTIDAFDGYTHSSDTVTFTLTDTSGTWASASSVLATNSNGNYAAAHIFVTSSPANAANGALVTGYAGSDTSITPLTGSVPDGGSTVILLGSAMMSLASIRVWFSRK